MVATTQEEEQIQTMDPAQQESNGIDPAVQPDNMNGAATQDETAIHTEEDYIPDVHLPDPSIWPFVMACGLAILMAGIVIHLFIVLAGLAVFVFGLGGWLYQDIQVARRGDHH
jgi:hypothetical protein